MKKIREIIDELYESKGSPLHLSDDICGVLNVGRRNTKRRFHTVPNALSGDMNAAVELLNLALPGWGWRMATCCVSDDAWIFPDFNSPSRGAHLKKEFRQDIEWIDLTDVDLRPSGRPAIALLISILIAKEAIENEKT